MYLRLYFKKKSHNRFNNLTPLIQSVIELNGPAQTDTLEYNTTISTACSKTLLRYVLMYIVEHFMKKGTSNAQKVCTAIVLNVNKK